MYVLESELTDEDRADIERGVMQFDSVDVDGNSWYYAERDDEPTPRVGMLTRLAAWFQTKLFKAEA